MTDDEFVRMTMRLPTWLHAELEQRAKAHRRSLHSEILMLLKRFSEAEEYVDFQRRERDADRDADDNGKPSNAAGAE